MFERTSIGLDVHVRSVVGCAIDGETGEVFRRRLTPDFGEILAWILSLPGPVKSVYEAGPTSFGLARFLLASRVDCVVAAPSKLQRPSGDRVKTDANDAKHLARLLRLGEVTAVAIPTVEQEAARDLVRARDCANGSPGIRYPGVGYTATEVLWNGKSLFETILLNTPKSWADGAGLPAWADRGREHHRNGQ